MPTSVPTPLAAALGLVPTVVSGARRLPAKAVQLPVLAVSSVLNALDGARQEYDELADRGERLIARLRGTSLDQLEDAVEDRLHDTPLAATYGRVEDAVEQAATAVGALAEKVEEQVDAAAREVDAPAVPDAEAPKGVPTPKATEPSAERVDTAAAPEVVQTVEEVAASTHVAPVATHDELPLADYDHMTLGALRGRLRSLELPELVQVRAYEKAHADRLPVVTMLDNRIARLATDGAATPSPGGAQPTATPPPAGTGKVIGPSGGGPGSPPHTKVRTT